MWIHPIFLWLLFLWTGSVSFERLGIERLLLWMGRPLFLLIVADRVANEPGFAEIV